MTSHFIVYLVEKEPQDVWSIIPFLFIIKLGQAGRRVGGQAGRSYQILQTYHKPILTFITQSFWILGQSQYLCTSLRVCNSVGIEMQFQYRYQTLFRLRISIDIEILFQAVKSIILHLLILQLSKIILLTFKIYKTDHEYNTSSL